MNKRPGPSVGFTPIEKTAGKIASPASKEIKIADFGKFCCLDRYELYVTITETPTLSEKNACPMANKMVWDVSFEKSGYKKKDTPSIAPSNVKERIMIIINKIKRAGIKILFAFSIPF